jgi:hypothetical protein
MIDLINKNADEINILILKYASVLESIKPEIQPHITYIIEIAYNYLQEKYKDLHKDWKSWVIVILKNQFNNINNDNDILKNIDDFINHYHSNYSKYCEDTISTSEFDRDYRFIRDYLNKKLLVSLPI